MSHYWFIVISCKFIKIHQTIYSLEICPFNNLNNRSMDKDYKSLQILTFTLEITKTTCPKVMDNITGVVEHIIEANSCPEWDMEMENGICSMEICTQASIWTIRKMGKALISGKMAPNTKALFKMTIGMVMVKWTGMTEEPTKDNG